MTPADIARAINTEKQAVLKKFMALRVIATGQVDLLQVYGRSSGPSYNAVARYAL